MSITSKDLLNLSMELAKESNNRILENQKLKLLNLKEKTNREINEERLLKHFQENYLKINGRIDSINDELENLNISNGILEESDKLIKSKLKEINVTEEQINNQIDNINIKVNEQFKLQSNENSNTEDLANISNDIVKIEQNLDILKSKLEDYNEDLVNLKKAKVSFEISFYLESINNIQKKINSKSDIYISIFNNIKRIFNINKEIIGNFEKIMKRALENTYYSDYKLRFNSISELNKKLNQKNDLQKIKYDTINLDVENINNDKTLITNNFNNISDAKDYLELVNSNLTIIENSINKLQDILNDINDINNNLGDNLFGLEDLERQIKISNSQNQLLKSQIDKLEDKIANINSQKKTITKNENETTKQNIPEPEIQSLSELKILKRKVNKKEIEIDVNNFKQIKIYSVEDLKKKISNKEVNIPKDFIKTYSTSFIRSEEISIDSKEIKTINLAQNLDIKYKFMNLQIKGQGIRNRFIFSNDNIISDNRFMDLEITNTSVDIINKEDALQIASIFYKNADKLEVELCYYSSTNSDLIIPAYLVTGKYAKNELIETYIPASLEYLPVIKFKEVDVTPVDSKIDDKVSFLLTFKELVAKEKVQFISSFENKYLNENKVIISLPKYNSKEITNHLKFIDISLSSINNYGFSYNISLSIDLSKYIDLFKIKKAVENKIGNLHNYGVEWGEDSLGSRIFLNYINKMEDIGVTKEYSFNSQLSKEINFIDNAVGGKDNLYIDYVDTLSYIGHGNGDGITFMTEDNDNKLNYSEAKNGNAWGNKNLEFMALLSCKVLKSSHNNLNWAERWGGVFNGLHLLCGFQTNAHTGEHSLLSNFAENQYKKNQTIVNSWINAANSDQPSDNEVVVMGPLILNDEPTIYNSVKSEIPNLNRAYWNDKIWGVENGPGKKIYRNEIKGWWRIVSTV